MYGSVLSPESMVYLAGAFYAVGMAITNQIILRLLLLAGTCVYLVYYATIGENPLWEAIYVSLLIGIANIGGLSSLIARQSRFAIPRTHADIFYEFPRLPPGDFRALMKLARRYHVDQDKQVTLENEMGDKLFYVLKGSTLVRKGEQAFVLPPRLFLGEVSFLTGVPSSASAWLEEGAEVLEWQFDDLRRKCARSPRFKLALEAAISIDLAGKVARSMGESSVHVNDIPASMMTALSDVRRV